MPTNFLSPNYLVVVVVIKIRRLKINVGEENELIKTALSQPACTTSILITWFDVEIGVLKITLIML